MRMKTADAEDATLVRVENLCKNYGQTQALCGISFNLKRGEILGLLGPNGAGKTTALQIILGLLEPTAGKVSVFGLSPTSHRHEISKRLNFSSAYVQFPSNLKVIENLNLFAKIYNVPDRKNKIEALLKTFDLGNLRDHLTGSLSSGEKTRLNLAKCFLNDPELLVLDEPTASLDPDIADVIRQHLKRIQREAHMGILLTSHNMFEVEEMCDRIIFVHHGKLISEGTPAHIRNLFSAKTLQETFIKIVREGHLTTGEKP